MSDYQLFSPGDEAFGVNFYPTGARIFRGKVLELLIKVTMDFKSINYKIDSCPIKYFPQENVFSTEEEANKAVDEWLNNIKDKQHEEDFNTPSMLPYDSDSSSSTTTTQRISAFCRRNS